MLSDFLIEKDTKGEAPKIRTQIKRLENLSISMSMNLKIKVVIMKR